MSEELCCDCRFFKKEQPNHGEEPPRKGGGWCRRYAPEPLKGGSGTGWSDWEWPSVSAVDGCGEWSPQRGDTILDIPRGTRPTESAGSDSE